MQQIQQSLDKRAKFRQQIRTRQVNQTFRNIRRRHQKRQQNSQFQIEHIDEQIKKEIIGFINKLMTESLGNYYKKDYQQVQKSGLILKSYMNQEQLTQFVSNCLNDQIKINGGKFVSMQKKDINKQVIQMLHIDKIVHNPANLSSIQQEVNDKKTKKIVHMFMKISQKVHYNKFCLQSSVMVLKLLWIVIQLKYHIPPKQPKYQGQNQQKEQQAQQYAQQYKTSVQILNSICISLANLLNSPHHALIKNHLNKMGLHRVLNQIIEVCVKFESAVHYNIINLIYLFNNTQVNEKHDVTINGVSIINVQSQYKSKYVLYSIFLIKKQYKELYELALITLDQLFEESPFFIDTIKAQYYSQILQLILHPSRKVNVAALNLINTITFYSQSASDELVQDKSVLDYLYKRLILEKQMNVADAFTKTSVQKCSNILCDLLLTKNTKLKKSMFAHHIWQLIYESMDQNHRLFGAIVVFKYFFAAFGRKQRFLILPHFLQAVRNLPLQNEMLKQIKQIRQTLLNIFYHSMQHEPDDDHQQLLRLYDQNGLLKYIELYEKSFQKV